jgi:CheY-like chemotaxis protein
VEDSRHSCEAMRLICQRSGARIRRAESLASAARHLRSYRPRIAVIDLGLPDGSGLDLIASLSRSESGVDGIIAISGDDTLEAAAFEAGADSFMAKPLTSITAFQRKVLNLLPAGQRPEKLTAPLRDQVAPDKVALRDDLALAVDLLNGRHDATSWAYLCGFLASLGKDADDPALIRLAGELDCTAVQQRPKVALSARRALEDRMEELAPV